MNTIIQYLYKNDSGKVLFSDELVMLGELSTEAIDGVWKSLLRENGHHLFIPCRVGLASLSPILDSTFDAFVVAIEKVGSENEKREIDQFDHPWHELIRLEGTSRPTTTSVSAQAFQQLVISNSFKDHGR